MRYPEFSVTNNLAMQRQWRATLGLRFAARNGRTTLVERRHSGPLLVQKALYPEGGICHVAMLHPPAGIAGGDELAIDIAVDEVAHAVLTTPGATRWYKSLGRDSLQQVRLTVAPNGHLDWLPQENIIFDQAQARLATTVVVANGGSAIGWDVMVLGRRASGERWTNGEVRLETSIRLAEHRLWIEAATLDAGSPLRRARVGLDGCNVMGTLWAVGAGASQEQAERMSTELPCDEELSASVTCLGTTGRSMLLLRVLGNDVEMVRRVLVSAWSTLRPIIHGVAARPLRLWST